MRLLHSVHWRLKRTRRREITDDLIEYAIQHAPVLRDRAWEDVSNVVCRVPPMGRLLKVVYRPVGKDRIKVITAFWLD